MKIREIQKTGEQSLRFSLDGEISLREVTYRDSTEALVSPMASKLFGFSWTEQVRLGKNYVEVTKQDWVDWPLLEEPLKGLIEEHFAQAQERVEENPQPPTPMASEAPLSHEAQTIQSLIERDINPNLAAHGGFVVFHRLEENRVFLEMGGGCQGCAMSYQTMKEGIEKAIKDRVPSIAEVVDVTDHSRGQNPYL